MHLDASSTSELLSIHEIYRCAMWQASSGFDVEARVTPPTTMHSSLPCFEAYSDSKAEYDYVSIVAVVSMTSARGVIRHNVKENNS